MTLCSEKSLRDVSLCRGRYILGGFPEINLHEMPLYRHIVVSSSISFIVSMFSIGCFYMESAMTVLFHEMKLFRHLSGE